jgi:hypothetical protein
MTKTRKQYDREFKREAVRLLETSGKSDPPTSCVRRHTVRNACEPVTFHARFSAATAPRPRRPPPAGKRRDGRSAACP